MKIATVIPLKKGPLKEDLTYFTAKNAPPGSIVTVPIRNKKILGLVVSIENVFDSKINIKDMDFNLKKIADVKENSIFLKEYIDAAMDVSRYFVAAKNNVISSLIPAVFREKYDEISNLKDGPLGNSLEDRPLMNKIKTEKLLFQAPLLDRIASYRTFIRESFALKKSVFMVLPTESDIKSFYKILSRGIEKFTFDVYSGLSAKKTIEKYKEIMATEHPVLILGTAPFLSIPRRDIGTIILEHDSGSSYRTIAKPYLDLRVFAELFAAKINAKFILSDTLLSFETLARKDTDNLALMHPLSYRINFEGKIEVIGKEEPLTRTASKKKFKVLKDESIKEIRSALEKKKNVFIFALRKGLATQTICKDCYETVNCETCLAPAVLYTSKDGKKRIFSCNRCKKALPADTKCKNCESWNLTPLGIGTDTVVEELKKIFPEDRILKLDKEIAKSKKGAAAIIKKFEESKGAMLVGTEMAFSYLTSKVPLSVIASFDSLWSIPSFTIGEKIIQIILSIIDISTEKLIVQTKNENDPAILAVKNYNLLPFVREELGDRKKLNYPPYKRFIKITHTGNKGETARAREMLSRIFEEYKPEIFSGFIARMANTYATNALIKIDPKKWSLAELSNDSTIDENLLAKLLSLPPTFEIIVDPEDLL